ncbi:MAG: ABC-2 type transport system ATP-binding protein [Halobacteriales archaeon]|jgi:ABC-2 type transport system ATP-binding protein
MTAIDLNGVTKEYGDVLALNDLDLRIDDGEIFGFLGPNGAGKSTTINILLDFVRPTAGSVEVLGLDARQHSQEIRARTGVLPEGFQVYERLTGRQHLQFAIESKGTTDDPDHLLDRVGIPEAADRKAGGYSKGMKQRLTMAMALVGEPELLILDEPTTGLDPRGAKEVRKIVRQERDRGATVFFSSHILEQVQAVCDRVGILREGELVAVDTIDGLREAAGGESSLSVRVDAVTDGVVEAVRSMNGVQEVTVTDSTLSVTCEEGVKTRVITTIEDNGATVEDFSTEETSLEDLFMSYTSEGARP